MYYTRSGNPVLDYRFFVPYGGNSGCYTSTLT